MSKRAISKIAKSEARACADDLILALKSASEAKKLAAALVRKYTVGARTAIMDQALELTAGKRQIRFDEDTMASFIKDLIAAPKPQGRDKLIVSIAKFTDATMADRGSGWGTGVLAVELGSDEDGLANTQAFVAVGESLRNRDDHLAESLAYIVDAKAPVWAVQLWESMARPAIGDLSRPYSLSQNATSTIIGKLSRLNADNCSEGLPLLMSVLLTHSDSESRDKFLASPIGKSFRENLLGTARKTGAGHDKDADPLLREGDRQLLRLIRQRLLDKDRELDSLLEAAESKHAEKLGDYQNRLRQAQSEQSRLSGFAQKSRDDASRMKANEEQFAAELAENDKELARQASEIRHLEREKKNQEVDQTDRHHEALQKRLVEPAATVRDLVIEISEPKASSKIEPRALAVAFDTLHRRILNLAKVEDERIPRHILAGKEK